MARNTDLLNRSASTINDNQLEKEKAIAGEDYSENMFQEGHNRTASKGEVKSGREYDRAAHTPDNYNVADQEIDGTNTDSAATGIPLDTFHSRDGTDAAGLYDETGGPLGGTEKELDDLEASGTPVDRNPHMKD